MIKVLLADDSEIVRMLLCHVLEKAGDMHVLAVAWNGEQAVIEAITHYPDVAVMDISMPTMDGLEATRQICSGSPATRVLIVSSYHTPQHIRRALEAGALGYLLKDDIRQDLVMAVRALHRGSLYFSKRIAELARLYIHGESGIKTNSERGRAVKRLKRFSTDRYALLIFSYAAFAEFFC